MDERTLKVLAMKSMSAMLSVVLFSAVFTRYNNVTIYANENSATVNEAQAAEQGENEVLANVYTDVETGAVADSIYDVHLVIKKPSEENYEVSLEDLYMNRQIRVSVPGLEEKVISKYDISFGGTGSDPLLSAAISYEYDPNTFLYTAVMDIQLDDVYAHHIYEDKQNIYIELRNPHEVYEKIIIVDAGHGGNDVGAYTKDMEYFEKDINLNIQKYLKKLLDKGDIKVYYTRLSDEKVYLNPRLDLGTALEPDMFISIHCNSSEYIPAKGSEVLYSTKHQKNLALKSDKLASIILKELVDTAGLENRGIVNGDNIYIIGNSNVPIALIEVGFISNKEDLEFITKKANQKLIAEGIYNGILKVYEELGEENGED